MKLLHAVRASRYVPWVLAAAVALPAGWWAARALAPSAGAHDVAAGLAVATANALVALLLNRRAAGGSARAFRWLGVGGNVLRFVLLLAILTVYRFAAPAGFEAFGVAAVVAAAVFGFGEVAGLHGMSLGRPVRETGGNTRT